MKKISLLLAFAALLITACESGGEVEEEVGGEQTHKIELAYTYLDVMAIGMVFYFINPVFTAIFNGSGDSRTPFIINTIGLVLLLLC